MSLDVYPVVKSIIAKIAYENGFFSYYRLCKALKVKEDVQVTEPEIIYLSSLDLTYYENLTRFLKRKDDFLLENAGLKKKVSDEIKNIPRLPLPGLYCYLRVFKSYWRGGIEWRSENEIGFDRFLFEDNNFLLND